MLVGEAPQRRQIAVGARDVAVQLGRGEHDEAAAGAAHAVLERGQRRRDPRPVRRGGAAVEGDDGLREHLVQARVDEQEVVHRRRQRQRPHHQAAVGRHVADVDHVAADDAIDAPVVAPVVHQDEIGAQAVGDLLVDGVFLQRVVSRHGEVEDLDAARRARGEGAARRLEVGLLARLSDPVHDRVAEADDGERVGLGGDPSHVVGAGARLAVLPQHHAVDGARRRLAEGDEAPVARVDAEQARRALGEQQRDQGGGRGEPDLPAPRHGAAAAATGAGNGRNSPVPYSSA